MPQPPHPHHTLIASKAPNWVRNLPARHFAALRTASTAHRARLEQACRRHPEVAKALALAREQHHNSTLDAQQRFAALPDLDTFASTLLSAAIKKTFDLDLDVSSTCLFDAVGYAHRRQQGGAEPQAFVRSLKHHALQNFEDAATHPGGMDVATPQMRSVILDARGYGNGPPFENAVAIDPTAFATLCRTLDVGGQYQALIDRLYYPTPAPKADGSPVTWLERFDAQAPVLDMLGAVELSTFCQSLHAALLLGHIGEAAYTALLATPLETSGQAQVTFSFLTLWQIELTGLVLIRFEHLSSVLLYTPHDLDAPLKEHADFDALRNALRDGFQRDTELLTRHIPDAHKDSLTGKLLDHLMPLAFTLKNRYERVPAPDAHLPLQPRAFATSFRAEMLFQNFTRLRDDARFHAVPTLAMDARTFQARLAYFESIALDALGLVGFVVPEVGALMMLTSILQLGHEVYEGFESWANDDRQQAFDYLLDVLENIALIAITTAGGHVIQGEPGVVNDVTAEQSPSPAVETPSFIEELVEVELPDGSRRLWKPDLTPYIDPSPVPAQAHLDEVGLYRHEGKLWLKLDGHTYALRWNGETGDYRIAHPDSAFGYEPPLRHNGAGAWQHELDRPGTWHGLQLFQRLGPPTAVFDEQTARQILQTSGTDEGVLRQALHENLPMPAQFTDSLQRFRLDQEVRQLLPEASTSELQAAFAERYRQMPVTRAPEAAVLQHVYPQLPNAFTEELLRHASPAERQALGKGRIPRRIGEEVRLIQQQVRLTRAYEGLFLDTQANPDTERLILHSLPLLPGWSADTSIELTRGILPADHVDSIGPQNQGHAIITRTGKGYLVSADAFGLPGSTYGTFHDALFAAFPEQQRQALAPLSIIDGQTLTQHIRQAPMLPRWALRKALKMQRPGPRSPMRLADGRLGYRLSGEGPAIETLSRESRQQFEDLALAPGINVTAERMLSALEAAGRSPSEIQQRIGQLRSERLELRQSLDHAFEGEGTITGLGARRSNREAIEMALWEHWIHSAMPELGDSAGTLRLSQMYIAEFPRQLPEFIGDRVRRLQLHDITLDHSHDQSLSWHAFEAQLNNLFQHFPNLAALEVERGHDVTAAASEFANSLPLITRSFPRLEDLRLVNQNLTLYPLDIERFASREHMRYLDISGNRLAPLATFRFPDLHLDYLGMDRMGFSQWPEWLDTAALLRVRTLSLRHNQLARVPALLTANGDTIAERTRVQLEGNVIRADQLLQMYRSLVNPRRSFDFSLGTGGVIEEYEALRVATDHWLASSQQRPPLSAQRIRARTRVTQALLDFWERRVREDTLSPLQLEAFELADFPPALPAFYSRYVDSVRLTRVQLGAAQLEQWLMRFPQISQLTLDDHIQPLLRLPEALTRMPELDRLSIRNQGLEVDDRAMSVIARIPALRELDLSGNRLSPTLTAAHGQMRRLERLALRNMALDSWPQWLFERMPRFTLDLRENHLTTLPRAILDNPPSPYGSMAILLTDNPLQPETMRTAHLSQRYDRSFTFDMDLPFDILSASPLSPGSGGAFGSSIGSLGSTGSSGSSHRHGYAPWTELLALDPSPWLEGAGGLRDTRKAHWAQLRQAGDADNLLQLATQLTTAVPYRNTDTRPGFIERLWQVLEMASASPEEREVFDAIAADAIREGTCPDGMLLQFQQVEQKCFIALAARQADEGSREAELYRLLRRLFRQQRLDQIASAHSLHQDAAEVRLAYRRLLANRLDLLSPADEMMFGADVSSEDATAAALQIWDAEEGEDLLAFAASTPFWTDYLREAHADAFTQIETKFQAAVSNLQYDNPELSLAELEAPTRALELQRDKQVENLIHELTFRVRADHP